VDDLRIDRACDQRIDLRRRAWWIVALSSGVGWLATLLGHAGSADMTIPESNTFYSLIANAHFALAAAMMIGMFILILEMRSFSIGRVIMLAVLSLMLAIIQPFAPVAVYGIAGVTLLMLWWRNAHAHPGRNEVQSGMRAHFPFAVHSGRHLWIDYRAVAALALQCHASRCDPRAWSQQNQTPSPPPMDYVLGYGLLWIFAFFGMRQAWQRKSDWDVLLLAWIIVTLPMLYAPFPLQRRLSLGLHVPIGILAAIGLTEIVRARWARRALIGVALLTSAFIELALVGGAAARDPRVYLATNEAAALGWLQANAPHDAVVLASPEMGGFIQEFAGQLVLYVHPYETVNAKIREQQVMDFFSGAIDQSQMVRDYSIGYIFVGPRERKLGVLDTTHLPVEEVFSSGDVAVYRVVRGA
jgi:hypothetical protein